jgi:lysozyme
MPISGQFLFYNTIKITSISVICILFGAILLFLISKNIKDKKITKNLKKLSIGLLIFSFIMIGFIFYKYKTRHNNFIENLEISQSKNNFVFGIDVSQYNGSIDWDIVKTSKHPIKFVFIRSTMGIDGFDRRFKTNIKEAEKNGFIVGTYHFFRPNENPVLQFENFKNHTIIKKGHLLPVLDIEDSGDLNKNMLINNIKKWLLLAEQEYRVKPIIYTGRKFYYNYIEEEFKSYPLWIASYSGKNKLSEINYNFHQFTEKVKIKGIDNLTDGNDFNGNLNDLKSNFLIK